MKEYKKRIYNFKRYRKDILSLIKSIPKFIRAKRSQRISNDFAEKIMLAVTSVNDCRYCSWLHAKQAIKYGVERSEIKKILSAEIDSNIKDSEIVALSFAQHYAESDRNPDKEVLKKLYDYYGKEKAEDILLYIQFIYCGNLTGNTFDAFLHRFKGEKAKDSNLFFEFIFFLTHFPLFAPMLYFMNKEIKSRK